MRSEMDQMEPEERGRWERGEEGHWHTLCGMMRRGRGMLDDARKAGAGILPPEKLKEKKSLGKMGLECEPLVTDGTQGDTVKPEDSSSSSSDSSSDSDTDMSDPDSEVEDTKDAPAPEFTPIVTGKKRKLGSDGEEDSASVEPNPYFVVDTEPTPVEPLKQKKTKKTTKSRDEEVVLNKATKRISDDKEEPVEKKSKKHKKNQVVPVTDSNPTVESDVARSKVDFTAIERQLQAEVEARMRAKEAEDSAAAQGPEEDSAEISKKDKKRKRLSTGSEVAETKKVKKEHKEKKEKKEKKRKADGEDGGSKKRKVGVEE